MTVIVPASVSLKYFFAAPRKVSYVPCKIPWVPMYIHEPAVIWPYIISPAASSLSNSSHVAQRGTRLEFAISTRGQSMCFENRDRLSRLHEQRLVVLEPVQRFDDRVVTLPVARRFASSAIDDQFFRLLATSGSRLFINIRLAAS